MMENGKWHNFCVRLQKVTIRNIPNTIRHCKNALPYRSFVKAVYISGLRYKEMA